MDDTLLAVAICEGEFDKAETDVHHISATKTNEWRSHRMDLTDCLFLGYQDMKVSECMNAKRVVLSRLRLVPLYWEDTAWDRRSLRFGNERHVEMTGGGF